MRILMNRRKLLGGNGKISHEEAMKKAEKKNLKYIEIEK